MAQKGVKLSNSSEMVKNLPYWFREIVPVQRYISFTGIYHWYGKKMRNPSCLLFRWQVKMQNITKKSQNLTAISRPLLLSLTFGNTKKEGNSLA